MLLLSYINAYALPPGFVYLQDISPTIKQDLRYASTDNFVGRAISGYKKNTCILTLRAAKQLMLVQQHLRAMDLSLKVYDCYRPTRAVKDFVQWSHTDNVKMKDQYYPRESKRRLFQRGYIAEYSGHSRGSTVDLTIVHQGSVAGGHAKACYRRHRQRDNSIEMGSNFDCLDRISHVNNRTISQEAKKNRRFLQRLMREAGFQSYPKEWWHFSLKNEAYPRRYFNFPIQ